MKIKDLKIKGGNLHFSFWY